MRVHSIWRTVECVGTCMCVYVCMKVKIAKRANSTLNLALKQK